MNSNRLDPDPGCLMRVISGSKSEDRILSDSPPPGSTAIRQSVKLKVSQTLQVGGCQFNAIF